MNEKLNKAGIIEGFQRERARFEATLAQVSEAQMVQAQVQDEWTTRDILVHLTAWERQLLHWLEMAAQGQPPDVPKPGNWQDYFERFNAQAYAQSRDRLLANVLADSEKIYQQALAALQTLPEDPNDAYWSVWLDGKPAWGLLASWHEHYREHGESIELWLTK